MNVFKSKIHLLILVCLISILSVDESIGQHQRPSNIHEFSQVSPRSPFVVYRDDNMSETTESEPTESTVDSATEGSEEEDNGVTEIASTTSDDEPSDSGSSAPDDSEYSESLPSFYDKDDKDSKYMVPNSISHIADSFISNDTEYIIVQGHVQHYEAQIKCKHEYNGSLAFVKNITIAKFLAEALSETNLELDSLWVGGENISNTWYWKWGSTKEPIDVQFLKNLTMKNPYLDQNKWVLTQCLAFGRSYHSDPQFRILNCVAYRSFICQRNAKGGEYTEGNSTHSGWIKIGSKLFKIFHGQVSWENAVALCPKEKKNAALAVLTTNKEVQILGRYMLIGRPSLENAWIGAKYSEQLASYYYINTDIILPNKTGDKQFPPWKNNKVDRLNSCLLIDRHVSNTTVFLTARCDRLRSYICSISHVDEDSDFVHTDVIIGNTGYRLIHNKKPWEQAFSFCESDYKKYNGKLATIPTLEENFHLLYVMGENRTDVQHLWIGGKYIDGIWKWASSNMNISLSSLNMIQNTTYTHDVEENYMCLNMDRENHMIAFHYGTDCTWPQAFVCTFAAEDLAKLQKDEVIKVY